MSHHVFEYKSRCAFYSKVNPAGLLLLTFAVFLLTTTGCGDGKPTRVKVSGQVSIDGEPVNGGVVFLPAAGGRRGGGKIAGGNYSAMMYDPGDGLPTGEYVVAIISSKDVNANTVRWLAPEKYADVKTSGLTASVTEETESMNFELTWEGDKHNGPYNVTTR